MMKINEIKVGEVVRFAELWDGEEGDINELLESGCVSPDEENIVDFEVVEMAEDAIDTMVKITGVR